MGVSLANMIFDNTLGALLVGGLVAAALYGVSCVQTIIYFMRGWKDSIWFKGMVLFLWALDTFDTALSAHFIYFYVVTNHSKPEALSLVVWSIIAHVVITGLSNFIIRSIFAQHVYMLSRKNPWVAGLIMGVSAADLIFGLVLAVKAFRTKSITGLHGLSAMFYANFGIGTGSVFLAALFLCYYLWEYRTGVQRTDSIVQSLIKYVINTCLLVVIDATAGMIAHAVMPHNFVFFGFYLLLNKLYLNSYLVALNTRGELQKRFQPSISAQLAEFSGMLAEHVQPPEFVHLSPRLHSEVSRLTNVPISTLASNK